MLWNIGVSGINTLHNNEIGRLRAEIVYENR